MNFDVTALNAFVARMGGDVSSIVDLAIVLPVALFVISMVIYVVSVASSKVAARRIKLAKSLMFGPTRRVNQATQAEILAKLAPKADAVGFKAYATRMSELVLLLFRFNRRETEKKLIQAGERDANAISRYILRRGVGMVVGPLVVWFGIGPLLGLQGLMLYGLALGAVMGGGIVVDAGLDRAVKSRRNRIANDMPVFMDLLTIYLEAGGSFDVALARGANALRKSFPTVANEVAFLRSELEVSVDREKTLREFSDRLGTAVARTFVSIIIQSERRGNAIAPALRSLARESRKQVMADIERRAQKIPTVMQLPMFLFILPAIFGAVIGPAVVQAIARFGG